LVYGWLARLERALYPTCCLLCGQAGGVRDLCDGCAADLPYDASACPLCALPAPGAGPCGRCLARPPAWDAAFALLRYAYPADVLLKRFKYGRQLAAGRVLGELMAGRLAARPRPALIVPVPLHPARERERGFNQARELARPIARALRIPLDPGACVRTRATPPQSGLDARARRRNVRGAFALRRPLGAGHIAIVDDVLTTGATAAALASVLRRAGARRIELWCAARAQPALNV
jgi:ComF family protein